MAEADVESRLADIVDALIGLGSAVRRDEPDAVHKARTMTRRLRAILPLLPGRDAHEALAGLRRYGRALGGARDLEVRAELGEQLLADIHDDDLEDAAHERLVTAVRRERAAAHAAVVEYLDGPRYRHLLEHLEAVRAAAADLDGLAVQHEARKHARAMRYLAEVLGDEKTAATGAALQDAFGAQRDYTLLARSLEGETDESITRVRDAAWKRARAY
ncbi:MAG: CHAD domain-containing protein [Microbacteriaceae bacterium]|nr:CHAD domain-containing protein [Microbacteriaceae bacterium]